MYIQSIITCLWMHGVSRILIVGDAELFLCLLLLQQIEKKTVVQRVCVVWCVRVCSCVHVCVSTLCTDLRKLPL